MRVPNRTLQELCDDVYKAVFESTEPLTRLEICRAIGRKKSPHIVNMIRGLRDGGFLREIPDKDKWGRDAFRYEISDRGVVQSACQEVIDQQTA